MTTQTLLVLAGSMLSLMSDRLVMQRHKYGDMVSQSGDMGGGVLCRVCHLCVCDVANVLMGCC